MKLTLIRHPQTEANVKKIIYGRLDYPYSQLGKNQFDAILDYIQRHYIKPSENSKGLKLYTSPSRRTQALAIEIGKLLAIPVHVEDRIAEMNFGIFEGHTSEEIERKYPEAYNNFIHNFSNSTIPDGESYGCFVKRIEEVISEQHTFILKQTNLESNFKNEVATEKMTEKMTDNDLVEEIILVTHGAVIREFIEKVLELGEGSSWKFVVGNACIIKFEYLDGNYRLKELISNL